MRDELNDSLDRCPIVNNKIVERVGERFVLVGGEYEKS
jgi:hypothetical protein